MNNTVRNSRIFLYLTAVLLPAAILYGCSPDTADAPVAAVIQPEHSEEPAAMRREETVVPILEESAALSQGYYYDEALECLSRIPEEFLEDPEVIRAKTSYMDARDSFVPYEQPVRHIFFHSLIVDTALAFDGDYMENGYNYWMTTADEFRAILEELYANQYILIDIHDLCEEQTGEDGSVTLVPVQPMVPEGKIPLVLSVDDVNYYDYMKNDGFARNLMLDEEGNVKNLYIDENGNEWIGNYDVVPILDAFVEEHPDFSLRGAKGLLALTGYEGVLGYRINDGENPFLEQEKEKVRAVAARLKETGWQFACHGYGHKHAAQISYDTLASDTSRWREEVGSLVGDTDVYIYPYGEEIEYPSEKLSLLQSQDFRFFCGVWSTQAFVSVKDTYVRQTRCNLDGFTMKTRPEAIADLIDVSRVLDASRPELK